MLISGWTSTWWSFLSWGSLQEPVGQGWMSQGEPTWERVESGMLRGTGKEAAEHTGLVLGKLPGWTRTCF